METELISIASIICVFAVILVIFTFLAFLRYLRYRETLDLAEQGLVHPNYNRNGKGSLRWGIAITGLGLALCAGMYPIGWVAGVDEFPLNFGPWMLVGLVPTFFGLSLIAIYLFTRESGAAEDEEMDLDLLEEGVEPEES